MSRHTLHLFIFAQLLSLKSQGSYIKSAVFSSDFSIYCISIAAPEVPVADVGSAGRDRRMTIHVAVIIMIRNIDRYDIMKEYIHPIK
jgi:hypothetical protein